MTQMQSSLSVNISSTWRTPSYVKLGIGFCLVAFPLLSIFVYAAHPNLSSLQPVQNVDEWISEWHGNQLLHFAHVVMLFCVPLIIAITIELMSMLRSKSPAFAYIGGTLAVVGAVFLAADKGALCLVNSAFDTLSPAAFAQIHPAIAAMKAMQGWLWLLYGLALLPIGFIIIGIALYRTRTLPRWQAALIIVGSALLLNPDIEIISVVASVALAIALVPLGVQRILESLHPSQA